ncbi:MAG: DMT family transporter [Armatimonadetes bacterium]|nr:DMT family transporter [Armatimonadota bacterium]
MMIARKGIWMMLLSAVFFAAMSALVRGATGVHSYTMVLARFVVGTVLVALFFVFGLEKMRWRNWPWIVARGVSGGIACILSYWAIQEVGLARAVTLHHTYVIFAALFAVPLLGERVGLRQWVAIFTAAVGTGLLCGVGMQAVSYGDLVALVSGIAAGFAIVCVTRCRRTDSASNIFWSQSIFGIVLVAWPAARVWSPPTPAEWLVLLAIGLLATAGQLTMTYAYKFTGAAYGSLLSLLSPVLTAAIGILYFGEHQGAGFYTGAFLVLLACADLSLHPVRRSAQDVADALMEETASAKPVLR